MIFFFYDLQILHYDEVRYKKYTEGGKHILYKNGGRQDILTRNGGK